MNGWRKSADIYSTKGGTRIISTALSTPSRNVKSLTICPIAVCFQSMASLWMSWSFKSCIMQRRQEGCSWSGISELLCQNMRRAVRLWPRVSFGSAAISRKCLKRNGQKFLSAQQLRYLSRLFRFLFGSQWVCVPFISSAFLLV